MYQVNHIEDTIVAISTPLGHGGIGIVRLSGKRAVKIADDIFVSKNGKKPSGFKNFFQHYGWVIRRNTSCGQSSDKGFEVIDEALMCVMRAPKSYTKEDVVEISCHGGVVALKLIVTMAVDFGARLAEPGEFTKRAFLNGRIDLAQAEAVLDIIEAKTDRALQMSLNQLKGDLSIELAAIRESLMHIYTDLEAVLNFPEDELSPWGRTKLFGQLNAVREMVHRLLATGEHGKILREGIKIVICGRPNVGKSSLLNVILKTPRAIVTAIAGTTRDTIEETAQIKGVHFQLIDTAGILEPRDLVEEEAVKRSRASIVQADLILFVLDGSSDILEQDKALILDVQDKNVVVVVNKSDLSVRISDDQMRSFSGDKKVIRISALMKEGIQELEDSILSMACSSKIFPVESVLVSNVRHIQALKECLSALDRGVQEMNQRVSFEFVSEEIKLAVNCLDGITGRNIDSDLLDKIFLKFCIGK